MKRIFALLLPLLLLTACLLCGCRAASPAPAEEPAPAETPAPAEEPAPVEPSSSVGPAEPVPVTWTIEHTDLSEGLPVDMYFEIPVFSGDGAGLERINADLAAVRQAYVENSAPNVLETVRAALEYGQLTDDMRYTDTHSAAVRTCSDELISVTIDYGWWMGGVTDYGTAGYTYDARSGERLYLPDLLYGTNGEIKESIAAALPEQYPGVEEAGIMNETPMDAIRGMDVRDISFYVEDGAVHAAFAKYEIAYGAAGAFDVVLPGAIRPHG